MKGKLYDKRINEFLGDIGEYAFTYKGIDYHIGDVVRFNYIYHEYNNHAKLYYMILDEMIVKDSDGYFIMTCKSYSLNGCIKADMRLEGIIKSYKDLKNNEIIDSVRVKLEKDTDILKVDLHRYGSLIYGKILYQDDKFISRGNFKFTASNGIEIKSSIDLELQATTLFIEGNSHRKEDVFYKFYGTSTRAKFYFNKIQQAIKELNDKRFKKEIYKESYDMRLPEDYIHVKIRGRRTTVILKDDNIKGSVYCNKNDVYDKQVGIEEAYNKAIRKRYEKMYSLSIEELIKKHSEIEQRISSPKLNLKKNNTVKINNKSYIIKDVQCYNDITGEYRLLLNKIEDK